jgi:hypothetical protein
MRNISAGASSGWSLSTRRNASTLWAGQSVKLASVRLRIFGLGHRFVRQQPQIVMEQEAEVA